MTDLPQRCIWTDNNSCVCLYCQDNGQCPAVWRPETNYYDGECPGDGDPECCGYINCPIWDEWLDDDPDLDGIGWDQAKAYYGF